MRVVALDYTPPAEESPDATPADTSDYATLRVVETNATPAEGDIRFILAEIRSPSSSGTTSGATHFGGLTVQRVVGDIVISTGALSAIHFGPVDNPLDLTRDKTGDWDVSSGRAVKVSFVVNVGSEGKSPEYREMFVDGMGNVRVFGGLPPDPPPGPNSQEAPPPCGNPLNRPGGGGETDNPLDTPSGGAQSNPDIGGETDNPLDEQGEDGYTPECGN